MKLGKFNLSVVSDGKFWLDGGAMFGVVPKVLWNKLNPADEMNRIELGLNCLLIQTPENNILVDTGLGEKIDEKFKEMFRVERDSSLIESLDKIGLKPEDIDFVINTHLHFDHCGGNTILSPGFSSSKLENCSGAIHRTKKSFIPTFSRAKYIIQKQEWDDATNPNERTKASYLKENFIPIDEAGQLVLVNGEHELVHGIKVIITKGHTKGHQSVLIESDGKKAIYFGDLIPTASHIKIPYIMGYDLYPLDIIEKKKEILNRVIKENWLLIFEHDPKISFAYLVEENGKHTLKPIYEINPKSQNPNLKQIPTNQFPNTRPYDLKERTLQFAREVIEFLKTLPKTPANIEYSKQLIRSSGSIGANYIEADEALGKKDFLMRIRICRKESKESAYWLKLLECNNHESERKRQMLIDEATQFVKIFNSIVEKSK